MLLHELAHLARNDHRTELMQRILGAAFLFHPLVWATNRISRGYREMACDDAALARLTPRERTRSARALLEVVAHAASLTSPPAFSAQRTVSRTTHALSTNLGSFPCLIVSGAARASPKRPLERPCCWRRIGCSKTRTRMGARANPSPRRKKPKVGPRV
ncbi:MAG: hypothetical protein H6827_08610 [Planctomycetes bacterium]|nr:hypothetical protein [Planctomycetota bacterium]